jgi:hypothetical protein
MTKSLWNGISSSTLQRAKCPHGQLTAYKFTVGTAAYSLHISKAKETTHLSLITASQQQADPFQL